MRLSGAANFIVMHMNDCDVLLSSCHLARVAVLWRFLVTDRNRVVGANERQKKEMIQYTNLSKEFSTVIATDSESVVRAGRPSIQDQRLSSLLRKSALM